MEKDLGYTDRMGPKLRAEVERQLLHDFQQYDHQQRDHLTIDWSDTCPEGRPAHYLDGWLENWSDVWVVNAQKERIAWGWIDFIYVGEENPLFVFWHYLHFVEDEDDVVKTAGIPQHIWESLPEGTKDLLAFGTYDTRWRNDPLVLHWRNQR